MNRSWVSILGLVVMLVATGCGSDGGRRDSTEPERTSTSPTSPTVEPSQDVETSLDALTTDALSLHPQARLIDSAKGPEARARATYFETSSDTNLGVLVMPATLTISYPEFDGPTSEKRFLEMFEKHGFPTPRHDGLNPDDAVYASDALRCRTWLTTDPAWLRCVPSDYFEFVEREVADQVTSLYIESTGDVGLTCWQVEHLVLRAEASSTGAILRVGQCDDREALHFYVDAGPGWKEIPPTRACADDYQLLFEPICAAANLPG